LFHCKILPRINTLFLSASNPFSVMSSRN
jgi:hypothetical protein